MKKPVRVSSASKSGKKAGAKPASKAVPAKKAAPKAAAKPAKKAAVSKVAAKKPVAKPAKAAKPAPKKAAPKKAAAPLKKGPETKVAAKAAPKKPVKAPAKAKAKEEKPAKVSKKEKTAEAKAAPAAKAEGKRRGRAPKNAPAAEPGAESAFGDEPNEAALAAAEAEAPNDEELAEPVEAAVVKKPKATRRRRTRQLPRVPVSLRTKPAWAEAWTALAEAGLDAHTIPAVLRDASLLFIGLGELSPQTTEALFHFWEVQDTPGGIESILEEAFLSQPPQAERKSTLESFFRDALGKGTIQDALVLLGVARHVSDWRDAARRLKLVGSPHAEDHDMFSHAREAVG